MKEIRRPGKYPYQTILHKFHDVMESNTVKRGIAIVKSTANSTSCNCFGDRKIYIMFKIKVLSKVIPKFRAETTGMKFDLLMKEAQLC